MMNDFHTDWKGKPAVVKWMRIGRDIWYHVDGETHVWRPQQAIGTHGGVATTGTGVVEAPIPGKIIRLNVQQGQSVKTGDVVVVMEAMKMEYSLAADKDGTIKEIQVKEGETVERGRVLVSVE